MKEKVCSAETANELLGIEGMCSKILVSSSVFLAISKYPLSESAGALLNSVSSAAIAALEKIRKSNRVTRAFLIDKIIHPISPASAFLGTCTK